jgi:hypothetical protein
MLPTTEVDQPDPDTPEACQILGVSPKSVYRLGRAEEIDGYLLCNRRRWRRPSLKAYRERCIEQGAQLEPPVTGKRKPGRPRKHPAPEANAPTAE